MAKPKKASKKKTESLVQVTEANRKFCIKLGRILHVYTNDVLGNTFDVRPRIKKGWNIGWAKQKGMWKFFAEKDEDRNEYAERFDEIITFCIRKGTLYIDTEEQLIKYEL